MTAVRLRVIQDVSQQARVSLVTFFARSKKVTQHTRELSSRFPRLIDGFDRRFFDGFGGELFFVFATEPGSFPRVRQNFVDGVIFARRTVFVSAIKHRRTPAEPVHKHCRAAKLTLN